MTKVIFSDNTKTYDGSSTEMYQQYCMISSFFGLKEIPVSKTGITNDELNLIIKEYKQLGQSKPNFSSYLKLNIRKKKQMNDNKIDTIKIHPMENSSDCLEFTNKNLENITNILENLKNVKLNINMKKESEIICNSDDEQDKDNNEWSKNCNSELCMDRNCCIDKKRKILTKSKVSLLRNGSRDYSFMLNIKYEKYVDELIKILEESKETVENELNEKNWIKDVGSLL